MKNSRCFQLGHFTQVNNCLHLCLSYFQSSFLVHLSSLRYQHHSISVVPWIITHHLGIFCFIKYGFFNRIKIHFCLYSSCLPVVLSVSQSVYISVSSFQFLSIMQITIKLVTISDIYRGSPYLSPWIATGNLV